MQGSAHEVECPESVYVEMWFEVASKNPALRKRGGVVSVEKRRTVTVSYLLLNGPEEINGRKYLPMPEQEEYRNLVISVGDKRARFAFLLPVRPGKGVVVTEKSLWDQLNPRLLDEDQVVWFSLPAGKNIDSKPLREALSSSEGAVSLWIRFSRKRSGREFIL